MRDNVLSFVARGSDVGLNRNGSILKSRGADSHLFDRDIANESGLAHNHGINRRQAEDVPQLPLGQKITLARRGTARVAGALLADGHTQVLAIALDNPGLTEAQVLKALSRENLPVGVVKGVAQHRKWSHTYNVRLALVRHRHSTLSTILAYLPELTVSDLRELAAPGIVSENLRKYLQAEIQRRIRKSEKSANVADTKGDSGASNSD